MQHTWPEAQCDKEAKEGMKLEEHSKNITEICL